MSPKSLCFTFWTHNVLIIVFTNKFLLFLKNHILEWFEFYLLAQSDTDVSY